MLDKVKPLHWGFIIMLCWGALALFSGVLRLDPYQVDEGAARALLVVWSVADRVITPIIALGIPDFRALLFIPLGLYWPGSMVAAKVFTLLITFLSCALFYHWSRQRYNDESALLATGLTLISPLTLIEVDRIGTGPFLLLVIALGYWLNRRFRHRSRPLGGWFFLQMLLIIVAVSIHPAALAYPVALAWEWYRNPVDDRQQRHFLIGIGLAVVFSLLLHSGWDTLTFLDNPLTVFADLLLPAPAEATRWLLGLVILTLLLVFALTDRPRVWGDMTDRMLLLACALGLIAADGGWALLCVTTVLYQGSNRLIRCNQMLGKHSFAGQRGLVMVTVFILATLFMQADKAHYQEIGRNQLPDSDILIMTLADELAALPDDQQVLVMSQWPGRTMLAVKRPVASLPPHYDDAETLLRNIRGATHLLFNPRAPDNRALARQLASLPGYTRTLMLQPGGVLLALNPAAVDTATGP